MTQSHAESPRFLKRSGNGPGPAASTGMRRTAAGATAAVLLLSVPSWTGPAGAATTVGDGSRARAAAPAGESLNVPVEIPADAGPGDFVRLALDRNPGIAAATEKVERIRERIPQAVSLPDPRLTVAPVGDMAETAAGRVDAMVSLSQSFPLGGKLGAGKRIVEREVDVALGELAAARVRVAAEARRAWWSYYYAQRGIEVTRASRELLDRFRQVAEAKYRSGTATQQDVLRISVEIGGLDNDLFAWEQRRVTAAARLNRLLDRPAAAPLPEAGIREPALRSIDPDALRAGAFRDNPFVRAAESRIEVYEERRSRARLERWPDLTVFGSYNWVDDAGLAPSANGRDQWWLGVGINIPLWPSRLDAVEREAERGVRETASLLDETRNRVAAAVEDALARVDAQRKQGLLLQETILPEARQTLEVSMAGYRSGRTDFLTVIDNWRKLLDFQLMYHQSVMLLEQALADLDEAVGIDPGRNEPEARAAAGSDRPEAPGGGKGR